MKKILVIKQTSLGDVLHATGHIRSIKEAYPDAQLYVMTATSSALIYRHHPCIDKLILIDRYRVKHHGPRHPLWAISYMLEVLKEIRSHQFDLAIDLQGLAKSVFFLYFAHAKKKVVKGRWWGLIGFRDKHLHAIKEMDEVLCVAGIPVCDSHMAFHTESAAKQCISDVLSRINPAQKPLVIMSAFSRWQSKDWPLTHYLTVARAVSQRAKVIFTGDKDRAPEITQLISAQANPDIVNLAGQLSLSEFAELCARATCMVTGDSFPMHVCVAKHTPVIALFGPTNESRVGPLGADDQVIRAPDCLRCDRADCPKKCLEKLPTETVISALENQLDTLTSALGPVDVCHSRDL